jgi:hypothetical protein
MLRRRSKTKSALLKGPIRPRRLVPYRNLRRNLAIHRPLERPDRAINTVACEPLRLQTEATPDPLQHGLGDGNLHDAIGARIQQMTGHATHDIKLVRFARRPGNSLMSDKSKSPSNTVLNTRVQTDLRLASVWLRHELGSLALRIERAMSVASHIEQILAMTASSQNGAAVPPLQEMLLAEIARALDISEAPQTDADAVQKFANDDPGSRRRRAEMRKNAISAPLRTLYNEHKEKPRL